jgi:hypothetical protein
MVIIAARKIFWMIKYMEAALYSDATQNAKYYKTYITNSRKLFITITITISSMSEGVNTVLNFLRAASMQITIWRWEALMIARHGWDWGYKDRWERF